MKNQKWESFEEVATYLLNQMASEFGLQYVEGKQKIKGLYSNTEWEIDAKGVKADNDEAFIIIECRRYTKSKQKQTQVAALAYTIKDTRATGGIIVSPLGLQEGAAKIAQAENIINVIMNENSTRESYMLSFLNKVFIGLVEHVHATDTVDVVVLKSVTDSGKGKDEVSIKRS